LAERRDEEELELLVCGASRIWGQYRMDGTERRAARRREGVVAWAVGFGWCLLPTTKDFHESRRRRWLAASLCLYAVRLEAPTRWRIFFKRGVIAGLVTHLHTARRSCPCPVPGSPQRFWLICPSVK
jgi:hypothetical protein